MNAVTNRRSKGHSIAYLGILFDRSVHRDLSTSTTYVPTRIVYRYTYNYISIDIYVPIVYTVPTYTVGI